LNKKEYPVTDLTKNVIGAAIEVHRLLGPGFNENVYEEAFSHELEIQKIPFIRQKEYSVPYKSIIAKTFCPDFVVYNKIIVELKAVSELNELHEAQVLSYLKAAHLRVGLLINFSDVSAISAGVCKNNYWNYER